MTPRWSPAGEISESGCWVLFVGPHMYTGANWAGAVWQWLRHRDDDRFLVG